MLTRVAGIAPRITTFAKVPGTGSYTGLDVVTITGAGPPA